MQPQGPKVFINIIIGCLFEENVDLNDIMMV